MYAHWLRASWYVGQEHNGGVVVDGPMPLDKALEMAIELERGGLRAEVAQDTSYQAVWFVLLYKLTMYGQNDSYDSE